MKFLTTLYFILFFLFNYSLFAKDKNGPIARFSFDNGNEYDAINKKRAKFVGTNFTEDRFGNKRHAVYFYGNENSYVNLGTEKKIKPAKGSISIWVNIEQEVHAGGGNKINPIIITKCADREDFNESYILCYLLESKRICAGASRDSLKQVSVYSTDPFPRGTWQHLVICFDSDFFYFYINGKLESKSIKNFETKYNPMDSIILGVTASKKNSRYLNGVIDDIEFYDYVLDKSQVEQLYRAPDPTDLISF